MGHRVAAMVAEGKDGRSRGGGLPYRGGFDGAPKEKIVALSARSAGDRFVIAAHL